MNNIKKIEEVKYNITDLMINETEYDKNPNKKPSMDNQKFTDVRLIIKKLAGGIGEEPPSFILECRTYEEAVQNILEENHHLSILINYVNRTFNGYIDYMEEKQLDVKIEYVGYEIPKELKFETILESIEKCQQRIIVGDYSGAVTSARTLVEGVCKEILFKFPDVTLDNNKSLPSLLTEVRRKLNLSPSDPELNKSLKEVLTGLIQIVNGISEVRNKRGDSHLSEYKIDRHHALFVVNSAKTVVTFLFNTYEYQLEKGKIIMK